MAPDTKKHIYLDYAASTPIGEEVALAMQPYFGAHYGNPGSLHWFGQQASAAVMRAREQVAKAIGARHREIIFTGSATEANNLALRGVMKGIKYQVSSIKKPRIITTAIEHESVLETCKDLAKEGVEVVYVPVSKEGIVDVQKIKEALNKQTALVSIMYANNEVGTIQPIKEIAELIASYRTHISNGSDTTMYPFLHTDAVQAVQYLDCNVDALGVDMMTLSAHKIYGPKGVGALYARSASRQLPIANYLSPIITGGGQEYGMRSGTENVPGVVGFGAAIEKAVAMRDAERARVAALSDTLLRKLKELAPKAELNGAREPRLPNNVNVYLPGESSADLLIKLDLEGVAISPGAACSARATRPSHVLRAMGLSDARCNESIRLSLGRMTTAREIEEAAKVFKKVLA